MHKGALHFVTRRPPGPESDFVELENGLGQSLGSDVAHWRQLRTASGTSSFRIGHEAETSPYVGI